MSVHKLDVPLVLAAAALAKSSPMAWSAFVAEFRKYVDRVKEQCVMSQPVDLPCMQGRAREGTLTLATLESCKEEAEKLVLSSVKARN